MTLFLLVFIALLLIVGLMAVGVIFSNKPIKGTCGGLNALGLKQDCEICGGSRNKCESLKLNQDTSPAASLAYDALDEKATR